jgi:hypothetical protein
MSFTPTEEQRAIVEAFRSRRNLVVEAGAGAGKTSTLKQCATAMPGMRGSLIAPICLRCRAVPDACECRLGPQRWSGSSGLTRDQFLERVRDNTTAGAR